MIRLLYIPHERIRAVAAQWYSCGIWGKPEDKNTIKQLIDAFITKGKLKQLVL